MRPQPIITPVDAERLGRALAYAAARHGDQARKGTAIPYASHLLHVAGFVLEHGGSLDQAIAALLHDVIEDCGVDADDLAREFGGAVAGIVADCTDLLEGDTPDRKSDWHARKRRYLDRLAGAAPETRLVAACDKRHNLAALVSDMRRDGIDTLQRFNARPDQLLWYYRAFRDAVGGTIPPSLDDELRALVDDFAALIAT